VLLYVTTTECNYFFLPDNANPVIESFMADAVYCAAKNTQDQVTYYQVIINYCQQ